MDQPLIRGWGPPRRSGGQCSAKTGALHTNRKLWDGSDSCPRLANSQMELAHMLYETLLIRDEFAKILSLKFLINLWFNIYVPDGNTCTRLCSVLRVPPGIRPRFEFEIRPLQYCRTVLRYWRDAGWVRGTTSQLRCLRLIARTTLSVLTFNLYSQPTFGSRLLTLTPDECSVGSIPYRASIAFVAIRCTRRALPTPVLTATEWLRLSTSR